MSLSSNSKARSWSRVAIALWIPTVAVLIWMARDRPLPDPQAQAGDTREGVGLLPDETEFVRRRMRENLVALHRILDAAAKDDMRTVALVATHAGNLPMLGQQYPSLRGIIPPPWTQLGRMVHTEVGNLARAARRGMPVEELPEHLARVTSGCVSCHNTYRIAPEDPERRARAARRRR